MNSASAGVSEEVTGPPGLRWVAGHIGMPPCTKDSSGILWPCPDKTPAGHQGSPAPTAPLPCGLSFFPGVRPQ